MGLWHFMDTSDKDAFETKDITVSVVGKVYEGLEIHDVSPQMYAIPIRGEVATPAAESVGSEKVTCIVSEGEAIILDLKA